MNTDNTGVTVKEQNTDVLNQNNLFGNAGKRLNMSRKW